MSFVVVKIDVKDACDSKPLVESVLGTETKDGDRLLLQGMTNLLTLRADKVTLKVSATDASGNVTVKTQHLTLSGQKGR
jgi:hypothetical protein